MYIIPKNKIKTLRVGLVSGFATFYVNMNLIQFFFYRLPHFEHLMNTSPHVVYQAQMVTTIKYLEIVLLDRTRWLRIPDDEKIATVECIIKECCKHVGILPSKRYLFGIFNRDINYWLPENMLRTSLSTTELLELRVRFHPSNLAEIFKDDIIFLTYYFCQIRKDFIAGRIKELCGCVDGKVDKSKKEIAHGLGIADMYREMLQCNKTISDVEKEHKRFFPKELLKSMHYNLYKNVIRQPLKDLESNPPGDSEFIMLKYVEKVRAEAMTEFYEPYECQYSHEGKLITATICVENSATQSWRLVLRCPALNEVVSIFSYIFSTGLRMNTIVCIPAHTGGCCLL